MKIIGANFKMNFKKDDINNYLEVIKNKFPIDNIIFFPSDLYIESFAKNNYLVGSQNISFQEFGAVTGDTSILQLKELGIKYTLIGHSERRKYFNDDNYIADKMKLALKNDIHLSDNELDYLYLTLKKEYKILLSDDYQVVFDKAKSNLSDVNLQKLLNLYLVYRKMYEGFFIKKSDY